MIDPILEVIHNAGDQSFLGDCYEEYKDSYYL